MPIDFDCAQCGQRLRVGDEAVGRSVRCTACQHVQQVPATLTDADFEPVPSLDELPIGPPRTMNPYAAPVANDDEVRAQFGPDEPDGPPWERERYTLESFFATIKQLMFSPRVFFNGMRRHGGHLGPMRFIALSGIIGTAAMAAYGMIYTYVLRPGPRLDPTNVSSLIGGFFCCAGILGPLACMAYLFAAAGVFHAALMICDSTDLGWETTFRVVAYSFGAMLVLYSSDIWALPGTRFPSRLRDDRALSWASGCGLEGGHRRLVTVNTGYRGGGAVYRRSLDVASISAARIVA